MKRISIRIVLSVLLLVIVLLGVTFSLLLTQSGSRWLLDQVPGLTVEGWQGAVLRIGVLSNCIGSRMICLCA